MNGKKVMELRKQKGLTLEQLGAKVGVSHGMIARIESGSKEPSIKLLVALAVALGVTPGELIDAPEAALGDVDVS